MESHSSISDINDFKNQVLVVAFQNGFIPCFLID